MSDVGNKKKESANDKIKKIIELLGGITYSGLKIKFFDDNTIEGAIKNIIFCEKLIGKLGFNNQYISEITEKKKKCEKFIREELNKEIKPNGEYKGEKAINFMKYFYSKTILVQMINEIISKEWSFEDFITLKNGLQNTA